MSEKIDAETQRVLELMGKTEDHARLRELSLVVESLVMTYKRLKS